MEPTISRYRSVENRPVVDIFKKINDKYLEVQKSNPEKMKDAAWLQKNIAFSGEVFLGHLRYGTHGRNEIENCHPMLRQSNWRSRWGELRRSSLRGRRTATTPRAASPIGGVDPGTVSPG
jgi:hypothetical protein